MKCDEEVDESFERKKPKLTPGPRSATHRPDLLHIDSTRRVSLDGDESAGEPEPFSPQELPGPPRPSLADGQLSGRGSMKVDVPEAEPRFRETALIDGVWQSDSSKRIAKDQVMQGLGTRPSVSLAPRKGMPVLKVAYLSWLHRKASIAEFLKAMCK